MNAVGKTALFAVVLLWSSVASGDPGAGTRGFVVTAFAPAIYEGDDQCPEGFAEAPDTKAFLAKLPDAERVLLVRPENRVELICEAIANSLPPSFSTVKGKLSYGLNLDGSDGAGAHGNGPRVNSCAHENFVGPSGERGIDNQWYRAIGCMQESRAGGVLHEYFNTSMRKGDFAILIEIDGIDDPLNDAEVRVGFYSAATALPNTNQTAGGKVRMQVHYDNYFHSVARGRIVKGILTTEPVDVRLKATPEMRELMIRDARVQMEVQPAGKLKGILGGYQEFRVLYRAAFRALDSDTTFGPLTCSDFRRTVKGWLDGYPGSNENGPCNWISVAYEVEAVPAAVIHSETQRQPTAKQTDEAEHWWRKLLWWQR